MHASIEIVISSVVLDGGDVVGVKIEQDKTASQSRHYCAFVFRLFVGVALLVCVATKNKELSGSRKLREGSESGPPVARARGADATHAAARPRVHRKSIASAPPGARALCATAGSSAGSIAR